MTNLFNKNPPGHNMHMMPGLIHERQRMLAERQAKRKSEIKLPQRISNSSSKKVYDGLELKSQSLRPGADDFLAIPSRFNDVLHYRDGRKVVLIDYCTCLEQMSLEHMTLEPSKSSTPCEAWRCPNCRLEFIF
jgi:hypothetical protein